jgi:hypothetical protein
MTEQTSKVLAEVAAYRNTQDARWGGPVHDDQHSHEVWLAKLLERVGGMATYRTNPTLWRLYALEATALLVATIETHDRAYHTDPTTGGAGSASAAAADLLLATGAPR